MHKYADDIYLLIPSNDSQLIQDELDHSETWSTANNLHLYRSKFSSGDSLNISYNIMSLDNARTHHQSSDLLQS